MSITSARIGFLSLVTPQFRTSAHLQIMYYRRLLHRPNISVDVPIDRRIGMAMIMCSTWTRMMERIFRATWMRAKARSLEYRERRGQFVFSCLSLSFSRVAPWKLSSPSLFIIIHYLYVYRTCSFLFSLCICLFFFLQNSNSYGSIQSCHFLSYEIPTRSGCFIC